MLESVTEDSTIAELCGNKEIAEISEYMFTHMTDDVWNNTIAHYGNEKCAIITALKRICEIKAEKPQIVYDVYSDEQIAELPELKDVKIIHMPGEAGKPFVLVCPGGGYAREWVMVEGYPIAEQLNRMGYTAFILIYRTGQIGLLPKPIDDVAMALRFINEHRNEFQVMMEGYALAGFSAGGHLAAEWGTKSEGYEKYGLEKPSALFLAYPAISCDLIYNEYQNNTNPQYREGIGKFLERVGGKNFTGESLREYSIEYHMDEEYPATYIVHCQDDLTVPVKSSYIMDEKLKKYNIPHATRFPEHGGHSFGVGNETGAEGWLKQAVEFWENMIDKK